MRDPDPPPPPAEPEPPDIGSGSRLLDPDTFITYVVVKEQDGSLAAYPSGTQLGGQQIPSYNEPRSLAGTWLLESGQAITLDTAGRMVVSPRTLSQTELGATGLGFLPPEPSGGGGGGGGAGPTWTAYDQALLEAKQLETRILAGTLSRQLALDEYDAKMKDWEARFSAYESQQVLAQERQERARKILQDVLPYSSPGLKGVQVSSLGYMPTQKLNLNQLLGPPAAAAPVPPELSLPGVDLAAILGGV